MKTHQLLLAHINAAPLHELPALETLITRHYNNSTITAAQLMRLDGRIMERQAKHEK